MTPNRSTLPALLAQAVLLAATAAFSAEAAGVPAPVAYAPNVPPPLKGGAPQTLVVHIETKMTTITLAPGATSTTQAESRADRGWGFRVSWRELCCLTGPWYQPGHDSA